MYVSPKFPQDIPHLVRGILSRIPREFPVSPEELPQLFPQVLEVPGPRGQEFPSLVGEAVNPTGGTCTLGIPGRDHRAFLFQGAERAVEDPGIHGEAGIDELFQELVSVGGAAGQGEEEPGEDEPADPRRVAMPMMFMAHR